MRYAKGTSGTIRKSDPIENTITMDDGTVIPIDDILDISAL